MTNEERTQPQNADQIAAVKRYRRIEELIPDGWSQGTLIASGTRLHYYQTGANKPPVVLLHGFLDGALTWDRQEANTGARA